MAGSAILSTTASGSSGASRYSTIEPITRGSWRAVRAASRRGCRGSPGLPGRRACARRPAAPRPRRSPSRAPCPSFISRSRYIAWWARWNAADPEVHDPGPDRAPVVAGDGHDRVERGQRRRGERRHYLTAPSDRPWTSLSWAANPAMSTGSDTATAAAHTLARNRPWLVTKPVRKTGAVCATVAGEHPGEQQLVPAEDEADQRRGRDAGQRRPGRRPGAAYGQQPAPSIEAASSISTGTSARNERIIHTAIGRFIEV